MSGHARYEAQLPIAAPAPSWRVLRVAAEIYADFQQFRVAADNRAERGGVPPEEFADMLDGIEKQEATLKRRLRDAYRAAVPAHIREWQTAQRGLGEHTFARLLGVLGDPRTAYPWHWEETGTARHLVQDAPYPRTISQLWSYCGVGDPTRKRKRRMDVDDAFSCGSPRLRSLLFVISEGCVKAASGPYRRVYDDAREQYADRAHAEPCVRCGPSGKPAEAGSPWSKAHQHAAAMRKVAKEILRDLWLVAGEGAMGESEPKVEAPLPATSRGHGDFEAQRTFAPASQSDEAAIYVPKPTASAPPVALGGIRL